MSFLHPSSSSKFAKVALNDKNTIAESRLRDLNIDDTILFYDENKKCWRNGVIEGKEGTKVLLIKTPDGVYCKHLDQVIKRSVVSEPLQQTDLDTPRDEQSSTATDGDLEKTASLPESTEPETSIIVGNNPNLPAKPDHKAALNL